MDARSGPVARSPGEDPSCFSRRELAQAIGCSVSWVKKWRKRLGEGDPQDPALLCSCSRAHSAPYFRWDERVIKRIVEMRFAPPENLKRVPGPRALLYYLPRDPELQAAQVSSPQGRWQGFVGKSASPLNNRARRDNSCFFEGQFGFRV